MDTKKPVSDDGIDYLSAKYKDFNCCGRYCKKKAKHGLKIVFLNKIGWFCDTCKYDLLASGLAEKIEETR